jgi:hypothetical protein
METSPFVSVTSAKYNDVYSEFAADGTVTLLPDFALKELCVELCILFFFKLLPKKESVVGHYILK